MNAVEMNVGELETLKERIAKREEFLKTILSLRVCARFVVSRINKSGFFIALCILKLKYNLWFYPQAIFLFL